MNTKYKCGSCGTGRGRVWWRRIGDTSTSEVICASCRWYFNHGRKNQRYERITPKDEMKRGRPQTFYLAQEAMNKIRLAAARYNIGTGKVIERMVEVCIDSDGVATWDEEG